MKFMSLLIHSRSIARAFSNRLAPIRRIALANLLAAAGLPVFSTSFPKLCAVRFDAIVKEFPSFDNHASANDLSNIWPSACSRAKRTFKVFPNPRQ
jgi:hypothetical protein